MSENLKGFVPAEASGKPVRLVEDLLPVVERIARVLPAEKVWQYFASAPSATGGITKFPYLRVNACLQGIMNNLGLFRLAEKENNSDDKKKFYQKMSEHAQKVLVWVEVGFEGLENLAVSPASVSWEMGTDVASRAEKIMTDGKQYYNKQLRSFVAFRNSYPDKDADCFAQYHLEPLLDRWQKK